MRTTTPAAVLAQPDMSELASQLRLSVLRLARILRNQDPGGLSPSMASALATVANDGPITLGELALREHVAPPTITPVVDKLRQEGLVSRRRDDADRRVSRLEITAGGRRLLEEGRVRRTAWLSRQLGGLDADDIRRLEDAAAVLERLAGDNR